MTDGLTARTTRDLDRLVHDAQSAWRSAGVSAGVVRDGRLAWSAHVGSARLDPPTAPTDDTQYLIGSVTKTFVACVVMALRDEGRLALTDQLGTYVPQTRHGALTVRQMLAHASGLQREPVGRIWESLVAPGKEQLLRELEDAERVLPGDFVWHYSNLAYAMLGQIIEQLEGRRWEESVRVRILDPLEMRRTGLTPDEDTRALGYQINPHTAVATAEPRFALNATAALGGLWSTVADLARYAAFVADPVAEVLGPDTVEEMCRPVIMTDTQAWGGAYGLGFGLVRRAERIFAGHGGGMPGFVTGLQVRRSDKVGAVVYSNNTNGSAPMALAADLACAVLDQEPVVDQDVWTPSQPQPELEGIPGIWWSEGGELRFEVRDNVLWCRVPSAPKTGETRFAREAADLYRAVEGRERGELLEVTRGADGTVTRMHFGTYAVTREPLAFGDLLADR